MRDAQTKDFRYFVILHGQVAVGFVSLVFRRPVSWSNRNDNRHLPEIIDLYITEKERRKGYGAAAIRALEVIASERGAKELHISVEPLNNPRAYTLYQRLGYQPLQVEPYFHRWAAVDGDDNLDTGAVWLVDMVKVL